MVFGEIVEPSTRALIDDDYEEYPDCEPTPLEWEGNFQQPENIESLIFVEGNKILKLFQLLVFKSARKLCSLKEGAVDIYSISVTQFVIAYNQKKVAPGEIISSFLPWINSASNIYGITNNSLSTLQNAEQFNKSDTLVRIISTFDQKAFNYKQLEAPNLVTGLGATVLSYCRHTKLNCCLFVFYMDNSPLDSLNTNPIIEMLKKLNLQMDLANVNFYNDPSNLYL